MESTLELVPGQLVISKAGRDAGKYFIVLKVIDEKFVSLVDGDLRKIENPKKKKVKHLAKTNKLSHYIKEKLIKEEKVSNTMVRREIEKLNMVLNEK
jgi:ribosomal protein L14E/L6E/L27E